MAILVRLFSKFKDSFQENCAIAYAGNEIGLASSDYSYLSSLLRVSWRGKCLHAAAEFWYILM